MTLIFLNLMLIVGLSYGLEVHVTTGPVNQALVKAVRDGFLKLADDKAHKERFDSADVQRIKDNQPPLWAERCVTKFEAEKEALDKLIEIMEWRKKLGINQLNDQSFGPEVWKADLFSIANFTDIEGHPILWFTFRNVPLSTDELMTLRFIAYHCEKMNRVAKGGKWSYWADLTLADISDDHHAFMLRCIEVVQHYPGSVETFNYIKKTGFKQAMFDDHVEKFVGKRIAKKTRVLMKEEVVKYIDRKYLPGHLLN